MKNRLLSRRSTTLGSLIFLGSLFGGFQMAMSAELVLDDRSSATLKSSHVGQWRLITDQVMGGVSQGRLTFETVGGRECLRMQGAVSTENNGGFIQVSLELNNGERFDASEFNAVQLDVYGNSQTYNIHFRTSDLWLPWQSYRERFMAEPGWKKITLLFDELEAYRTMRRFKPEHLERIGLVAIGREFDADLCIGGLNLLRVEKN